MVELASWLVPTCTPLGLGGAPPMVQVAPSMKKFFRISAPTNWERTLWLMETICVLDPMLAAAVPGSPHGLLRRVLLGVMCAPSGFPTMLAPDSSAWDWLKVLPVGQLVAQNNQ